MIIKCGKCATALRVDETKIKPGQGVKCPNCGAVNKVPMSGTASSPGIQRPEEPIPDIVGWLVVHDENTQSQTYSLRYGKNVVGRLSDSKPCDVMIDTTDGYMSRNHCVIEVARNRAGVFEYILSEVGSTNGTFINADPEKRLKSGDEVYLADGDTIQLGRTKVVLKTLKTTSNAGDASKAVKNSPMSHTVVI